MKDLLLLRRDACLFRLSFSGRMINLLRCAGSVFLFSLFSPNNNGKGEGWGSKNSP